MSRVILGIDIGSTKICSVIAEVNSQGPHIIGTGISRSQGIRRGAVVNIEQASKAIKNSIEDAKRMAGVEISKAIISLSGAYTKSYINSGVINVGNSQIDLKTIDRAIDNALYVAAIPSDYEVIHLLPFRFKLDDQDYIEDPLGMTGTRLEVFVHIVTAQKASLENLRRSVKLAGVDIETIVLSAYAASIAVLDEDEKKLGVACIDMGASTCELMVYNGNSMRYNDFLGVGSSYITNDIATILGTSLVAADEIKIKYGNLFPSESEKQGALEVPSIADEREKKEVRLDIVQDIISTRVAETITILSKSLEKSGLKDSLCGVVLTGGMVNLPGMREFASALFRNLSVRVAKPVEIGGLFDNLKEPGSTVAVGLILYGAGKFTNYEKDYQRNIKSKHTDLNMLESEPVPSLPTGAPFGEFEVDLSNLNQKVGGEEKIEIDIREETQETRRDGWFKRWITNLF
ncbi:cell division protein FtsA [Helicobacter sp. 13S00401-1]|uniref:cell division protein FtsA n=1 Tax=Helicobacter sp. 13S00401-1 TaxID=1905758 RepID=UPI000BA7B3A1|nr:cell division protein FtsA [Helicobacter sp. 13S00401-1]PAF51320.1 cell division protein FtsA [Helicobacter sp. 13S00401-1]